jgi:hypothetical protein
MERHDHAVPSGWLVHDNINNHFLDLGSWYGLRMRVLARLPVIPMDDFAIENARLVFSAPGFDAFWFAARYELSEFSDGIYPDEETVIVSFGSYTETIPAASFVCHGSSCTYSSEGPGITGATIAADFLAFTTQGIDVSARTDSNIMRAGHDRGVDLSETANPVAISVQIGDDEGATSVRLGGSLSFVGTTTVGP